MSQVARLFQPKFTMQNTCPTVRVTADNEHGFIVINESDFDPHEHEHFDPEVSAPEAAAEPAKRRGRPPKAKE